MSNYNKVLLMGRLTRDPELRYTPQGVPVAEIGLAMNREYTVGTERRKETTFVDVTLWRRQAEVVCQYLKKGAPLFVEGHLTLDSWESPDGQKRQKLRVVADNFQFLGSRQEGDGGRGSYSAEDAAQPEGGGGYSAPRRPFAGGAPSSPEARPGIRQAPSGGGRIPSEAFSPIPDSGNTGSDPSESSGSEDSLGVDDSEIPF